MTRHVMNALLLFGLAWPAAADDHQPVGKRYRITVDDLPAPYASPSTARPSRRVAVPDILPIKLPPGFRINAFATGLRHARWLAVAENGDVLLAESRAGIITLLRDADGDGVAEIRSVFADGLDEPHGMAIRDGYLYVGEPGQVRRLPYRPGDTRASGPAQDVTPPGALGDGRGHWTRNLLFGAAGELYVAVGSRGNIAEEPPVRASVQRISPDGKQSLFASGLRNPVGIDRHPASGEIFVVVNERDGLGDGLVPDYLTRVVEGGFYGWPYAYIGPNPQPDLSPARPGLVARTLVPDLLFKSHSAPLGLVFYTGDQFPEAYRGDAFVALHGSWNAARPTGYKVVRVPFDAVTARPKGYYENFATGFWLKKRGAKPTATARVWGRPAGLAVAADGALLVADDVAQAVWRVSYVGG